MGLIDRIQAKIELFRLEQRYTRRRHRRSTFVSNAIYVDGEYIYQSPNSTGSSTSTSRSASTRNPSVVGATTPTTATATTRAVEFDAVAAAEAKQQKRLNRWSSMPGFGPGSKPDAAMGRTGGMPTVREQEWRGRASFDERRY
ncbi:hypothetical protein P885DRAFT_63256 [Corynascus similis CBS 632.67]